MTSLPSRWKLRSVHSAVHAHDDLPAAVGVCFRLPVRSVPAASGKTRSVQPFKPTAEGLAAGFKLTIIIFFNLFSEQEPQLGGLC